jgi:hypothetical protein
VLAPAARQLFEEPELAAVVRDVEPQLRLPGERRLDLTGAVDRTAPGLVDRIRLGVDEEADADQPQDLDAAVSRAYRKAPRPELERPPRSQLDDDFYRRVALAYRRAIAAGLPPSKTLAEVSETPPGTVNRWIAEARKRGHLPTAERGRVSA